MSLDSTPFRTFVALPLALLAEQAVRPAPLHPAGLPLLAAGFASYKLAGGYRIGRAGGPPGLSQGMPERLVTTGVYGWTRNPMYLGHLTFMTGAALVTRSPLAIGALALTGPWFGRRVAADEARLAKAFGAEYEEYRARVPRWLPGMPAA
jgi:protein-S-isoprenylcysteine O-methyltransferase Ste14